MDDKYIGCILGTQRCHAMVYYIDGQWTSVPMNKVGAISVQIYSDTAAEIVQLLNGPAISGQHLEQAITYIKKFNKCWTERLCRDERIAYTRHEDCIQFNSMSKKYSWLSNFFPSIIVDFSMQRAVVSVESAYVAFKIQSFDSGERVLTEADRQSLISEVITCRDSSRCKELGSDFIRTSDIHNEMAVTEVKRLNILKYTQNEKLLDMLTRSGETVLEENTGDPFWGTCFGAYTNPEENSNQLGKILMVLRESFATTTRS
jgi:predicted NAD-dependent protein-ADP-ribosyltransferase YbiA (DUF1768 family)